MPTEKVNGFKYVGLNVKSTTLRAGEISLIRGSGKVLIHWKDAEGTYHEPVLYEPKGTPAPPAYETTVTVGNDPRATATIVSDGVAVGRVTSMTPCESSTPGRIPALNDQGRISAYQAISSTRTITLPAALAGTALRIQSNNRNETITISTEGSVSIPVGTLLQTSDGANYTVVSSHGTTSDVVPTTPPTPNRGPARLLDYTSNTPYMSLTDYQTNYYNYSSYEEWSRNQIYGTFTNESPEVARRNLENRMQRELEELVSRNFVGMALTPSNIRDMESYLTAFANQYFPGTQVSVFEQSMMMYRGGLCIRLHLPGDRHMQINIDNTEFRRRY